MLSLTSESPQEPFIPAKRSTPPYIHCDLIMARLVEQINADITHLGQDICQEHSVRLYARGGHFTKRELIPIYFLLLTGTLENPDRYDNFLYELKKDITKSGKPFAFIDVPISVPDRFDLDPIFSEVEGDAAIISGLCGRIEIDNEERRFIAQTALGDMLTAVPADKLNVGLSLVERMNFISAAVGSITDKIPLIMYYGIPNAADTLFMCYAARCGFDVLCISPDDTALDMFEKCPFSDKLQKESLGKTAAVRPFPKAPVKAKINTIAYNAKKELDEMLYTGSDTMFRSNQFERMNAAVLATTYDEIDLLWDEEAKYRTGFAVKDDVVTVPVIFAKVEGVPGGDIKAYWELVKRMLTPETYFQVKAVSLKNLYISQSRIYARFHRGKQLLIDELMRSPLNRYNFLPGHLQRLIFEKAQAMINDGMLLMDSEQEVVDFSMYVALNLNREILQLLQSYDFTKTIPKVIIADPIEDPFSKLQCTQTLMLSYLGFDILVFCPTCYRDLETHISEKAFETHTIGEPVFGAPIRSVPRMKIPTKPRSHKKSFLFKKLF